MAERNKDVLISQLISMKLAIDQALMFVTGLSAQEIDQMVYEPQEEPTSAQNPSSGLREAFLAAPDDEEEQEPKCLYSENPLICPKADNSRVNLATFTNSGKRWYCKECGFQYREA